VDQREKTRTRTMGLLGWILVAVVVLIVLGIITINFNG
jgi:hypothetical protein